MAGFVCHSFFVTGEGGIEDGVLQERQGGRLDHEGQETELDASFFRQRL